MQLAIARDVAPAAVPVQTLKQWRETVEIFQTPDILFTNLRMIRLRALLRRRPSSHPYKIAHFPRAS
jgi:hypothetical protein